MAKKSQKRPLRHERGQAGCMWGLINMFDFRHGRSPKRLLSNRSHENKPVAGDGYSSSQIVTLSPTTKCESIVNAEEGEMPMLDVAKTSVKELMEEEMFDEHTDSRTGLEESNSNNQNQMKKRQKKRSRSRIKSSDLDMSENCNQVPEQRILDNLDLEMIMEELAQINQRNANASKNENDLNTDLDLPSSQAIAVLEEKLVSAVKLLTERFGEDGSRCCSKEFMDALKTLSLNKGALLKLLHDPNSKLAKHIQNLEEARLDSGHTPNSSDDKLENVKTDESSSRKHLNFFRRRTKSMESYKDFQSHNKIVILKPGQGGAFSPQTDAVFSRLRIQSPDDNRNTSQFSFTEIKRKLRHAIGKERDQNGSNGDNCGWSSPNRNHFYTERFLTSSPSFKKGEIGKLNDSGSVANIYVEAKKHLSEMLKSGGENPESLNGQLPKSLGRILSLPEYNGSSPRKYGEDIIVPSQLRFSPRGVVKNDLSGLLQEYPSNHPSPRKQHLGLSSSQIEDKIEPLDTNDNISRDHAEIEVVAETEETSESESQEEEKIVTSTSESASDLIGGDIDKEGTNGVDKSLVSSELLEDSSPGIESLISEEEDQLLSPPRGPLSHDSDCTIDKIERPSPISVLDPLFTDDEISPATTISRPVEKEIQPRHINFEEEASASDQGICTRISLEDEESAFEYVEAVLLGSGLNWDEFLLRWISTYEILDSLLFEEVELFSSRPRYDQKLLFDCANDALRAVCDAYFGWFKLSLKSAPKGMDLIREIWQLVEWDMFQLPHPHSLEQLVTADLCRSSKWMNLQSDFESIVCEMGEIVLAELVDELEAEFGPQSASILDSLSPK